MTFVELSQCVPIRAEISESATKPCYDACVCVCGFGGGGDGGEEE